MAEQRNRYRGDPPRPWVRLRLIGPGGFVRELELVVDTGTPLAVILGVTTFQTLLRRPAEAEDSIYGRLESGWVGVSAPELGIDQEFHGYANDAVVSAVRASDPDFDGLIGLSLLRLLEYGGDADEFWVRSARP